METKPYLSWNEIFKLYKETLDNKEIIKTKYEFLFNRLFVGSGCIITIVGRPGHGKTTLSDCILEDIERQNEQVGVNIIDFQLEMPAHILLKNMLIRNNINYENIEEIKNFYKLTEKRKEYYRLYHKLGNIENFYNYADSFFMEMRACCNRKINLVRFDHALMLRDRRNNIPLLMNMAVELKKKHNAIVIILSQINRAINDKYRIKDGSDSNKIKDTDIYDTDALMQFSDIMISIDRPYLRKIREFTSKQIVTTPTLTHIGIIKDRILDRYEEYLYDAVKNDYRFIEIIEEDNKNYYSNINDEQHMEETIDITKDDNIDF